MSLKLEVGEFYLAANGNITKIINYIDNEDKEDEYNYLSNDEEWYRYDGNYGVETSNRDLIAHIPKALHYRICDMVNNYYTDNKAKFHIDNKYNVEVINK